jgi:hypothetical protein
VLEAAIVFVVEGEKDAAIKTLPRGTDRAWPGESILARHQSFGACF